MLVVDASAMHYALAGNSFTARRLRRRIRTERTAVPEVHDLEVLATVRGLLIARKSTAAEAEEVLADHGRLDLLRYSHAPLRTRIWELRHNLTAYDAAYVALAEALDATLITGDAGIGSAPGTRCEIDLISD